MLASVRCGALALAALVPVSLARAVDLVSVVAHSGQAIDGVTIPNNAFLTGDLDNAGRVSLLMLGSGSQPSMIFTNDGGPTRLALQGNGPTGLPGPFAGTLNLRSLRRDNAGNTYFEATVAGSSSTNNTPGLLYRMGSDLVPHLVIEPDAVIPGLPDGMRLWGITVFGSTYAIDASDHLIVRARLANASGPSISTWLRIDNGAATVIPIDNAINPVMASSPLGTFAWGDTFAPSDTKLQVHHPADLAPQILISGSQFIPDTTFFVTQVGAFSTSGDPASNSRLFAVNDTGHALTWARWGPFPGSFGQFGGMLFADGSTVRRVFTFGDAAPGLPAGSTFLGTTGTGWGAPLINNADRIGFTAPVNVPGRGTVFVGFGGDLTGPTALMPVGMPAPGQPAPATIGSTSVDYLTANGDYLVTAGVLGLPMLPNTLDRGVLYFGTPDHWTTVIASGDVLTIDGLSKTVSSFAYPKSLINSHGLTETVPLINARNQLLLTVFFTDRTTAAVVVSVPSPSAAAGLGLLGMLATRRRRRK